MKYLPVNDFNAFNKEIDDFYSKSLQDLKNGNIALREFLEKSAEFDIRASDLSSLLTPDFYEFEAFFKKSFPNHMDRVYHEQIHARVASDYGLFPLFGVIIGSDHDLELDPIRGMIPKTIASPNSLCYAQPFTLDGVSQGGIDWTKEKFFQYINDTLNAVSNSQSECDILVLNAINSNWFYMISDNNI